MRRGKERERKRRGRSEKRQKEDEKKKNQRMTVTYAEKAPRGSHLQVQGLPYRTERKSSGKWAALKRAGTVDCGNSTLLAS